MRPQTAVVTAYKAVELPSLPMAAVAEASAGNNPPENTAIWSTVPVIWVKNPEICP